MSNKENCAGCVMPTLCLIACPNNQILDQMRQPICAFLLEGLEDTEQSLEIEFAQLGDKPVKKPLD